MKLLFCGAAGSMVNGFWIEPGRLSVTRAEISCARLPAALDGLRVGLMADIHFKPDQDEALLAEAVATLNREKPDLIALPGDFMDKDPAVIGPMLDLLKKLAPAHGVFASMGNHDGWSGDGSAMRRRFEKAGISFLINRNHGIRVCNENLAIAATDHIWLGKPDPAATLRGIAADTPVIALVHAAAQHPAPAFRPHPWRPVPRALRQLHSGQGGVWQEIHPWRLRAGGFAAVRHPRPGHGGIARPFRLSARGGRAHAAGGGLSRV
jgi:predicted MPP superfamily phosphohydrolase